MSVDVTLTTWMKLNGLSEWKGEMGKAGESADRFDKQFSNSMASSRRGVKETQHAVVGMSEAMDGSFKGAVQAFRGLTGLMETNPMLAAGAALAATATFFIKRWEEAENKWGEIIADMVKKSNEAGKAFKDAFGLSIDNKKIGAGMIDTAALSEAGNAIEAQKKKVEELHRIMVDQGRIYTALRTSGAEESDVTSHHQAYNKATDDLKNESEILSAMQDQKKKREMEYAVNTTEHHNKRMQELQKEADAKKKADDEAEAIQDDINKRQLKSQKDSEREDADIMDRAKKELGDLNKQKFSNRFDSADQYARMGGQIGGQANPSLRAADIQAQKQDKANQILEKMSGELMKVNQKIADATGDAG